MTDLVTLNKIASLRTTARSVVLQDLAKELHPLIAIVSEWKFSTSTSESGSAMPDAKNPGQFIVTTKMSNLGKTMHELTHIRCFNAFGADFVTYHVDAATLAGLPSYGGAAYGSGAYLNTLADRQMKLANRTMDGAACTRNTTERVKLSTLTNASGLSKQQKTDIISKLSYADQWPHVEHDPCINQILVWLHEWGYPQKEHWWKKSPKASTKAVVAAVEAEVDYLMRARAAG